MIIQERGGTFAVCMPDGTFVFEVAEKPTARELGLIHDAFLAGERRAKATMREALRSAFGIGDC